MPRTIRIFLFSAKFTVTFIRVSKAPFLPYWRVEFEERHFCAREGRSALGTKSKEVTCVPFSSRQSVVYCHGGRIGFFQGDIRLLSDDMKALRPTIFPVVPRLLNRMYDKVSLILLFFVIIKFYVPSVLL